MITEQHYRKLIANHRESGGVLSRAATKPGIDRKTAARYLKALEGPKERRISAPKRAVTAPRGAVSPRRQTDQAELPMYSRETGMLLRHYLEKEVGKTELAKRFGISRRTLYHWIRTAQFWIG